MGILKIKKALVSVSDKSGIAELCRFLHSQKIEIISTGGTAQTLSENGIPYTPIEKITQNPESFGGRMKTISFQIGSALLFRRDHEQDLREAQKLGIDAIDLVICNLYPFEEAARLKKPLPELIENIDIGGPTMVRAAAKNYSSIACVTSPLDYAALRTEMQETGGVSLEMRTHLALKAFSAIASYDLSIATELSHHFGGSLRYGENPHQRATLLKINNTSSPQPLASARFIQGKELSYNNLLDADQAFKCCSEINSLALNSSSHGARQAVVVIVKHGIPCGVAQHENPIEAMKLAWESDYVSAFGSVICMNVEITETMAAWFKDRFIEVLIAPRFSAEAIQYFASKKNVRLLECPLKSEREHEWTIRSINGGLLYQDEDQGIETAALKSVTRKPFSAEQNEVAKFGLAVTKYLKSNCIGLFGRKNGGLATISSGVGQPNRLDCILRLAGPRALEKKEDLSEAILVSDAFFPFRDTVDAAHSFGISNIIQPGGSVRDAEVVAACDEFGIAMALTGRRHFRH